jgi:hypothetical protein
LTELPEGICAPAHWHVPERAGSHVRAVKGVLSKIGRSLDPTQRFAVDVLTSAKADGSPASLSAAVICPRQNLKTYSLEGIVLTRLLRPGGDKLAVWSAHEVSTATETFRTFVEYAEAEDSTGRPLYPWFAERVAGISRATGRESITFRRRLPSGRWETCRLKFKARVKTGGRGLAGDLVVLDEAFALEPSHMGSLLPILSTKARGQIIYGSSAAHASSVVLHDVIRRGRAGLMTYVEWCAPGSLDKPGCTTPRCDHKPGTPGCVLDDLETVVAANPAAFHGRISRSYLEAERQELAAIPAEYARERLGWGEEPGTGSRGISVAAWLARKDDGSKAVGRRVFALDVTPDRGSSSIAVAGVRSDGDVHGGLVDQRPGTGWVVARLKELRDRHRPQAVVLDGASPAAALLPDLAKAGFTVRSDSNPRGLLMVMSAAQMGQACGGLADAVAGDAPDFWHRGDPIVTTAIEGAATRDIGDGAWGWARKRSDVDISSLVALTAAAWGLSVQKSVGRQRLVVARGDTDGSA